MMKLTILLLLGVCTFLVKCDGEVEIKAMFWNVFLRPNALFSDGWEERAALIPQAIVDAVDGLDVIVLAEVFEGLDMIAEKFDELGFSHVSEDLDGSIRPESGGIKIYSKWPIVKQDQHIFDASDFPQNVCCNMGIKYIQILKEVDDDWQVFNIFGTHLQSYDENLDTRLDQATEFKEFIAELELEDEPILVVGDFNEDLLGIVNEPNDVENLFDEIGAHPFPRGDRPTVSTWDPRDSILVGRSAHHELLDCNKFWCIFNIYKEFANCGGDYKLTWGDLGDDNIYRPSEDTRLPCGDTSGHVGEECYCPCCPVTLIDYILVGSEQSGGLEPISGELQQVEFIKADHKYQFNSCHWCDEGPDSPKIELDDLADHKAIHASYVFAAGDGDPPSLEEVSKAVSVPVYCVLMSTVFSFVFLWF